MKTLHESAKAVETANNWPWAYALGYVSGKDDAENSRKSEHDPRTDSDDYALGYFKGFSAKGGAQ